MHILNIKLFFAKFIKMLNDLSPKRFKQLIFKYHRQAIDKKYYIFFLKPNFCSYKKLFIVTICKKTPLYLVGFSGLLC